MKRKHMQINYLEKPSVIELNKKIITEWNKRHPESPEFIAESGSGLAEILTIVENVGNDLVDHKDTMIVKELIFWAAYHGVNHLAEQTNELQYCLQQYS